ncbi:ParB/RepB/Spo0J family partition protein [Pelagovum pacificum]|uniref:ParB/RepB/Spo0J family partition protein n=1 Tax=Pelagovum pacificum TaxID=2588711 RepID=A0A5C5GHK0_9RHOB|nr:ParB/RepB/Spo0J family partition protein [Pelagovum pacificum]QQA42782.1 ParB/RepB/Spo0J family partition protein [Pelagovum pacificum]TNY34070.1 ParB/RepB/Spo0J family partition protein [Pelagovum pacificum]
MADNRPKSRGLGRGLSALMADVDTGSATSETPRRPDMRIPIEQVHPNPNQPRRSFNSDALAELASSIREKGIIQPLIVRPSPNQPDHFEIVAGERRWRAAQQVQLHDVPVLVREFDDTEVLEVAIIENIQRADLNPVDEAAGYRQLMERFGHTQDQLASALGKSRSHIANLLRLLSLPDTVQTLMIEGNLSAGHARTLVGRDDAEEIAKRIVKQGLSVREAEKLAKEAKEPSSEPKKRGKAEKDADTKQIEAELMAQLRMGVSIDHKPGTEGGTVTLHYRDFAQLDDLLRLLSGT